MIQIVQAVSYVKNLFIDCLFYSALSLKVLLGLDFSFHNDEQKYKKHNVVPSISTIGNIKIRTIDICFSFHVLYIAIYFI